MEKNKYIVFTICCFVFSFSMIQSASAQWALPPNVFNLGDDLDQMILNLTNWLLGLVAMISVLAIIWGGLNYLSSSGDTQKADLSKRIIYYAFIGICVAGFAYAIVRVVTTLILV